VIRIVRLRIGLLRLLNEVIVDSTRCHQRIANRRLVAKDVVCKNLFKLAHDHRICSAGFSSRASAYCKLKEQLERHQLVRDVFDVGPALKQTTPDEVEVAADSAIRST